MMHHLRQTCVSVVLLGLFLAPLPVRAEGSATDAAGFFSPAALQKAQEGIRAIKEWHDKDLVIETFRGVPAARVQEVQAMDRPARNQFFDAWVRDQMKKGDHKDIYVLICRDPAHVHVGVADDTLKKAFLLADRDRLRDLLVKDFQAKDYDKGLLDAVRLVRERLDQNVPPRLPSPVANAVKDYAGFFSADAVRRANAQIKDRYQASKRNVIVETFESVPPDQVQHVESMTSDARGRFFADWVQERTRASKVDGIHILICRHPSHVQIGVGPETLQHGFTTAERDRLRNLLVTRFRDKQFDQGLFDALTLVQEPLAKQQPATVPPPVVKVPPTEPKSVPTPVVKAPPPETKSVEPVSTPPTTHVAEAPAPASPHRPSPAEVQGKIEEKAGFPMIWIAGILLGVIVLWIVIGILRAVFGRRPALPPSSRPAGHAPEPSGGYVPGGRTYQGPSPAQGPGPVGGGPQYNPGPAAGYPPAAPSAGGGGGGFVSGMLGGMFGAAAGSWIYDRVARRPDSGSSGWPQSPGYAGDAPRASRPHVPAPAAPAEPGAISTTGGDFDDPVSTAGGDFDDAPVQRVEATGGDFGGGGDFSDPGADARSPADTAGENLDGDFGSSDPADVGGGGDFGGDDSTGGGDSGSAGGDFGSADAGGDSAESSAGGDF